MRIMTTSYIKGNEYQQKFGNRLRKDIENDEEYLKFKEEEVNTKKMSTILKGLNHPVIKKSKISKSYNKALKTSIDADSTESVA